MFLININDILSVWTINYDILSIPDIENVSLFNIGKDVFVYRTYGFFSISGIDKGSLSLLNMEILSIHNVGKVVFMVYRKISIFNIDKKSIPDIDIIFLSILHV